MTTIELDQVETAPVDPPAAAAAHDDAGAEGRRLFAKEEERERRRIEMALERRRQREREQAVRAACLARYIALMCSAEVRSPDPARREPAMRELVKARIHYRLAGGRPAVRTAETIELVAECEAERARWEAEGFAELLAEAAPAQT